LCILNRSLLLSTYYFFPICFTIPNDLKNFKHVANLPWNMNLKNYNHFGHFFHINLTLWSAAARFSAGPKKGFLSIQTLKSCNLHGGNSWVFFHIFLNQISTRSYGYMCPKNMFFYIFVLVLEMVVFELFWWKHSHGPLGVKWPYIKHKMSHWWFKKTPYLSLVATKKFLWLFVMEMLIYVHFLGTWRTKSI